MDQELICRTCLTRTTKCISISTAPNLWGKPITISKLIMACSPVEITEDDGLPKKICESCLKHLQLAFLFRLRVMEANSNLRMHIRKNLVPRLQPISEGFLEPLSVPVCFESDSIMNEVFSMDAIVKSAQNNRDPLYIDSSTISQLENGNIKEEIKSESQQPEGLLPIEEVLVSGNMNQQSETQPPLKTDASTNSNAISTQTNTENYPHVILVDNTKSDNVQITHNAVNNTVLLTEEDKLAINSLLNRPEFKNLKNAKNKIIVIKTDDKNAQFPKPNDDKQIVVNEQSVSSESTEETVKVPTETTVIKRPKPRPRCKQKPPRPQSPLATNLLKNSVQLQVNLGLDVKNAKNHKRELPPSEDLPLKPVKRTYSRKSSVDNASQDQSIDLTTDDDGQSSSANVAAVRRPNSRNLNVNYQNILRVLYGMKKRMYPEPKIINSDESIVIEDD